jgi:hypothetical protein
LRKEGLPLQRSALFAPNALKPRFGALDASNVAQYLFI